MLNICHIFYSFTYGGAETMLVDIMNKQADVNNVTLIVINKLYDNDLLSKFDKKIRIYLIDRIPGSYNIFKLIYFNIILLKLKPSIVHTHNSSIISLLWRNKNTKYFTTIHSIGQKLKYSQLKKYNKVFAISDAVCNDILKRTTINPLIVYNGINTDSIKSKTNFKLGETIKLVQIGRLITDKSHKTVINALYLLINESHNYNFSLDFIGEGPYYDNLMKFINKLNLSSYVNFLGKKDRAYIYNNLCNYDIAIMPSIVEGFGLAAIEAIAAKLPVIASNIPAFYEISNNGKYLHFFNVSDSSDLKNKIINLIKIYDRPEFILNTEHGFNFINDKFSIVKTVDNYISLYKDEINMHN